MSEMIGTCLFGLAGVVIMLGIVFQSKATLDQGLGKGGLSKIIAIVVKYIGFLMLALLLLEFKTSHLILNLSVFISSAIVTFLLYLLARRASLR